MVFSETKSRKPGAVSFLAFTLLILSVPLAGCGSLGAAATPAPLPPTPSLIPPTATAIPPTDTPVPTATITPTITPIPALALVPEGMDPWCLPLEFGVHSDGPDGPDSMPKGARPGAFDKGTGIFNLHIPAITCSIVYTFNQPMPAGTMLSIYDYNKVPFLELPLTAAGSNPNRGYVTLSHPYIINPPFWWLDYTFVVTSPEGKEIHRMPVHVFKTLPDKCWDGSWPNPVTLFCPIEDA
ncbi:MAG: hypothetical protein AB9891_02070 [Anaerolineaceae bacterium]